MATKKKRQPTPTELAEARAQEEARAHTRPCAPGCGGARCHGTGDGNCYGGADNPRLHFRALACANAGRCLNPAAATVPNHLTRAEVERVLACVPSESAIVLRALAGEVLILRGLPPIGGRERAVLGNLLRALGEGLA